MRRVVLLAALALLVACGGNKLHPNATLTPIPPSSTPGSPVPTQSVSGKQTITITPHTGLKSGESVHIVAAGFSPNETLGVVECADKGTTTGQGDCDISRLKTVTSDAGGRVVTTFSVVIGPFGSSNVTCSKATPCLISVSQQTLAPTEEADAPITFG